MCGYGCSWLIRLVVVVVVVVVLVQQRGPGGTGCFSSDSFSLRVVLSF